MEEIVDKVFEKKTTDKEVSISKNLVEMI